MLIKLGKASDEAHKAEEKRKNEEWKKRNEEWKNSNDNYDYSKLFGSFATNYSDEEQKVLKKVYKIASSKLHPDVGGNEDDMKILNGLKQKWAI